MKHLRYLNESNFSKIDSLKSDKFDFDKLPFGEKEFLSIKEILMDRFKSKISSVKLVNNVYIPEFGYWGNDDNYISVRGDKTSGAGFFAVLVAKYDDEYFLVQFKSYEDTNSSLRRSSGKGKRLKSNLCKCDGLEGLISFFEFYYKAQ
jgi:hypothetical protein